MTPIDQAYNRQVRQRFGEQCRSLQDRIKALQAYNTQLSSRLSSLLETRRQQLDQFSKLVNP